jgi:hypothetical protein
MSTYWSLREEINRGGLHLNDAENPGTRGSGKVWASEPEMSYLGC